VSLPLTPSQTIGPFLAIGLPWPDGPFVVPEGTPGAITVSGVVLDGAGEPVPDALITLRSQSRTDRDTSWGRVKPGCFHPVTWHGLSKYRSAIDLALKKAECQGR